MLEFIEGFDHYTSATGVGQKGWGLGGSYGTVAGRFGGLAFQSTASNSLLRGIPAQSTRIIGFAFRFTAANAFAIMALRDSASIQVDLRIDSTGHLFITRNGTTLGSVATSVLFANTWYYIEWKTVIDNTAGSVDVHVDGTSVISGASLDTQNTANTTANELRIGPTASGTANYDDMYVCNSSGSVNNDFLGECRVLTAMPTSDGSTSDWTVSTGAVSWSLLDEADPNTTDYISSSTVGQVDLVNMADISPTGSILGVQAVISALKDDVGVRQIAEQCKSGATTYTGATTHTMTSAYSMYREIRETDPATGAQWTLANFNAAEFGVKVIA